MSRIGAAFARAAGEGRAALVIYLCAGDPDLDETPALALAAVEAGADLIELGVPFSDPTADGPTLQAASARALAAGATVAGVLDAARAIRARATAPIVLFGYYNPLLSYGEARLARDAAAAGVDGLLVVDLPPELWGPLAEPARAAGLDLVPLLAPTSTAARVARVAGLGAPFVYYVSMTGVTGTPGADLPAAAARAGQLSGEVGAPVAVGFGVRTPADVASVAARADGVVVGSAVVEAIAAASDRGARVDAVRRLVGSLARATRR